MKTKKDFMENYCSCPELAKKVFNQMTASWSEIKQYPTDYRDAGTGVGGFIYYTDTVKFTKKNLAKIIIALVELESDLGEPLNKPIDDETTLFNWYAWFALEHTIDQVIMYLED